MRGAYNKVSLLKALLPEEVQQKYKNEAKVWLMRKALRKIINVKLSDKL